MPLHWDHLADPARLTQTAPAPPRAEGIGPWPYVASVAGDGLDLITTAGALSRGGREANPVMGDTMKTIAPIKIGSSVVLQLLTRIIARKYPTIAMWLGYGNGIKGGLVARHNHGVAR